MHPFKLQGYAAPIQKTSNRPFFVTKGFAGVLKLVLISATLLMKCMFRYHVPPPYVQIITFCSKKWIVIN